jgi:hypothetical protein
MPGSESRAGVGRTPASSSRVSGSNLVTQIVYHEILVVFSFTSNEYVNRVHTLSFLIL